MIAGGERVAAGTPGRRRPGGCGRAGEGEGLRVSGREGGIRWRGGVAGGGGCKMYET
jgi:hypothetical protein